VYDDSKTAPPGRRGLPIVYRGEKLARPVGTPTPCYQCPKVPPEVVERRTKAGESITRADAIEPERWHYAVVQQVAACHAVGRFPPSAWLERWAAIVRPIILAAESRPTQQLLAVVASLASNHRR
jgi:hypothetical protein